MTRAFLVASLLALASARGSADPAPPATDEEATLERVREHFSRGEYAEAKALLEAAYATSSSPALLFALGQVSFNLQDFEAAIRYYERFLATNPDPEQAALAQQAIGAARGRLSAPPPPPPPPPPVVRTHQVHPWSELYTGLVIGGGVALLAGAGLIVHGHRLGDDESGTLTNYERRLERSRTAQSAGLALGIGGVAVIATAFVIWRARSETRVIVTPAVGERAAGLALGGAW